MAEIISTLNVIPLRHSHREQLLAYAFRRNLFLSKPSSRMIPRLQRSQSAFSRLRQTPLAKSAVYKDIDPEDKPFGGFKRNNVSRAFDSFPSDSGYSVTYVSFVLQQCRSMSAKNPSVRDVYTCPYRYKCNCYVALSVKTFANRVEIALAGEHDASSHLVSSGILSVKQRFLQGF